MEVSNGNRSMFRKLTLWRSDRGARQELLEALHCHAGIILGSATRVLGNVADAEDVAQDIAEKLLRAPPSDVRSWPALLKTMAVNASIDRLRRRREEPELPDAAGDDDPEAQLSDLQRAQVLRDAIAALTPRDARLFSLHYFGDLSQVEIGEELGMKANAVNVAIHRLRKRLAADVRSRLGMTEAGDRNS